MVQFSRNIDVKLDDGQTERFVVQTFNDNAVRVDLSADGSPYGVDIQTASEHPSGEAEFDTADYEQCLPLGTETYADTSEHSTASEVVGESVFIGITNNSGGSLTFTGQVSTHSQATSSSVQQFATEGTGERATAYRDGKAVGNSSTSNLDNVSNKRVRDSEGRYHGELTGDGDAQVLVDAISDRKTGAAVIIPDPGFRLDADVKVQIPAEEQGFSIETIGTPEWEIPSGFSDTSFIEKPATTTSDFNSIRDYYIGPMYVRDFDRITDEAINLKDLKWATVEGISAGRTSAVKVSGPNKASARNRILHPNGVDEGPVVELADGADQTVVDQPSFGATETGTDEVAMIDRGQWNHWRQTQVESAGTCFLADDAFQYRVVAQDWDRQADYDVTLEERGDAQGIFDPQGDRDIYHKARIRNPKTRVRTPMSKGNVRGVRDAFDLLKQAQPAHTLASLGLSDVSTGGGTVTKFFTAASGYASIVLETGSTSGDTGHVNQGGDSMTHELAPKYRQYGVSLNSESALVVRIGFHKDDDNYAELTFDPGGNLNTGHSLTRSGANWNFELVTGGTPRGDTPVDTGVAGDSGSVNRLSVVCEVDQWSARVANQTEKADINPISNGSVSIGDMQWRAFSETAEASNKKVTLDVGKPVALDTL
jgi:hypothetical protein